MLYQPQSRMKSYLLASVISCLPVVAMAGDDCCPPTDCQGCKDVNYVKPTGPTSPARGDVHGSRVAPRACSPDAAPACWFQPGDALYLRNNYPDFYEIVTMNGAKSHANNGLCIKNMLCFSMLANMDYSFYSTQGDAQQPGSSYGVGVRPLFRNAPQKNAGPATGTFGSRHTSSRNHSGSINNIDLFVDAAINKWVSAHIDLAYINASVKARTYSHLDVDWVTAYQNAAALKVNEAYFLLANPACSPLFFQIGRIHLPFGEYNPYPITDSFTQLLSEMRTGGVVAGAIFQNGLYASAQYSMNYLSFGVPANIYRTGLGTATWDRRKDRNWGGMVGFRRSWDDDCNCRHIYFNTNASYIDDLRDSAYLTGAFNYYNNYDFSDVAPALATAAAGKAFLMMRVAGVALHGALEFNNFGITGDYVGALDKMYPKSDKSQVWAWGVNGYVHFPVFCHHSKLELGYQRAGDSDVFSVTRVSGTSPNVNFIGPVLPHDRYTGTYSVELMDHIVGSLHAVVDRDNTEEDIFQTQTNPARESVGRSSYQITVRLSAEL